MNGKAKTYFADEIGIVGILHAVGDVLARLLGVLVVHLGVGGVGVADALNDAVSAVEFSEGAVFLLVGGGRSGWLWLAGEVF